MMSVLVRAWILLSALLVGAGWILSAFHQLNRAGYAAVFALAAVAFLLLRKNQTGKGDLKRDWKKFLRRFKRPAPFWFLVLVLLSFCSGSLYEGFNWDTNAYRLPRVLHWLGSEHWHWIHTADARMNIAGCNFEWLAAPLILFSHTDRFLFLINWLSYLMLPGLIFSVFTRWQVRPRVAWWWMWFLSAGWCFVFQASSVANDSFGVIYGLAAVDLAMRARADRKITTFWLSMLAIALATGIKQTNIPLGLVWLVAAWPCIPLFLKNIRGTLVIAVLALLVSFLPVSLFNLEHYGTWLPVENAGITIIGKFHLNPFWGIIGNAFCIPVQNLVPPLCQFLPPFYGNAITDWNEWLAAFTATPFGSHFASFETFGFLSAGREHGISEANAGLGLGICLLLLASIPAALTFRRTRTILQRDKFLCLLRATPWLALLVFMAKVGSYENARQLAPCYPFLLPAFLVMAGHSVVVRRRLWQWFGLATMMITAFLVFTLTQRPLFPPRVVFRFLHAKFPDSEMVSSEAIQYLGSMGRGIEVRRASLQLALPPDAKVVGYFPRINNGDEPALWLPFGVRRVELILPDDSPEYVRAAGVRYVIISAMVLNQSGKTLAQWLQKYNGSVTAQFTVFGEFISGPPPPDLNLFFVVRLN
jgi:hypothetical protein